MDVLIIKCDFDPLTGMCFQERSNAQVSCAGLFIHSHIGFDYPGTWLHIDMASPVYVVGVLHYLCVCMCVSVCVCVCVCVCV